jgi:hypothetical protein
MKNMNVNNAPVFIGTIAGNMGDRELALWVRMRSHYDSAIFTLRELKRMCGREGRPYGRDSIQSILRNLEEAGLIRRFENMNGSKFACHKFVALEDPSVVYDDD